MAITSIQRDWGVTPSMVRITATDTLAAMMTADYLTAQDANIMALNNGEFTWLDGDAALVVHAGGLTLLAYDAENAAFMNPESAAPVNFAAVAQVTTVGGAAAEAFAIPGALDTDLAFVQVVDNGTGNVTVLQAAMTEDTLTVTFSGNPGADTIINYQVLRLA